MMERTGKLLAGLHDAMVKNRESLISQAKAREESFREAAEPIDDQTVDMHSEVASILGMTPLMPADDYVGPHRPARRRVQKEGRRSVEVSQVKGAEAGQIKGADGKPIPSQKDLASSMRSLHRYVSERIEEIARSRRALAPGELQGYIEIISRSAQNLVSVRSFAEEYLKRGISEPYDQMAHIIGDMAAAARMLEEIHDGQVWRTQEQMHYRNQIAQQCQFLVNDVHNRRMQIMQELRNQRAMVMGDGMVINPGMGFGAPMGPGLGAPGMMPGAVPCTMPGAMPGAAPGLMPGTTPGTVLPGQQPYGQQFAYGQAPPGQTPYGQPPGAQQGQAPGSQYNAYGRQYIPSPQPPPINPPGGGYRTA